MRIDATSGRGLLDFGDLWLHRELLWILAARDLRLRYKQTALGVVWVVLQPLLATLIFTAVFGTWARIPSDGVPYGLFAFASLVGWNLFSGALHRGGNSLVAQSNLITKVYFPRVIIPLSGTLGVLIDVAISLLVFGVLLIAYGHPLTWRIVFLPAFLMLIFVIAAGANLWLSALNVYYRDFVHAMPFLIQIWMYATPVVYPMSIVSRTWRWVFSANPMVAGIEGVRWSLLGEGAIDPTILLVSCSFAAFLFIGGLIFFRRVERTFADVI